MNKITLLHEAITTRLDTVAQEHMLDVSDAYKKAYIQDGKMQWIHNQEHVHEMQSDFEDKRFIERKTSNGLYEILEYNDHQKKIFFIITRYLVDILDPEYSELYYHSKEYGKIPKGAIEVCADKFTFDDIGWRKKFLLPDATTCYTAVENCPYSHHGSSPDKLPPVATEENIIDELIKIISK